MLSEWLFMVLSNFNGNRNWVFIYQVLSHVESLKLCRNRKRLARKSYPLNFKLKKKYLNGELKIEFKKNVLAVKALKTCLLTWSAVLFNFLGFLNSTKI